VTFVDSVPVQPPDYRVIARNRSETPEHLVVISQSTGVLRLRAVSKITPGPLVVGEQAQLKLLNCAMSLGEVGDSQRNVDIRPKERSELPCARSRPGLAAIDCAVSSLSCISPKAPLASPFCTGPWPAAMRTCFPHRSPRAGAADRSRTWNCCYAPSPKSCQ